MRRIIRVCAPSLRLLAAAALLTVVAFLSGCGATVHQSATGSVHPSGWGQAPKGFIAPRVGLTSVPAATMYDSTTLSTIPDRPFALAGYTSGRWPTYLPMRRTWPGAHTVSIAVQAVDHADCLDVEPFDATPAQAGPWAVADIRAGFAKPCVYSDLSEMPAVQASLRASLGASWRGRVFLWLAWYRRIPGLVPGYDAVQYDDHCLGRNLDCSTVSLAFLSIAQPPYRPAPVLPVCFHRRETEARCAAAHAQVASDQRAAAASGAALADVQGRLARHRCVRPYRRATCVRSGRLAHTFVWRVAWFDQTAAAIEGSN